MSQIFGRAGARPSEFYEFRFFGGQASGLPNSSLGSVGAEPSDVSWISKARFLPVTELLKRCLGAMGS